MSVDWRYKQCVDIESRWFDNFESVKSLARWLVDNARLIEPLEVVYFFEKPWKWNGEWKEYQNQLLG